MTAGELIALAERCEAATGADRELDCRVWNAVTMPYLRFEDAAAVVPDYGHWFAPSYTTSLDAAMTLVPEGWDHGYQSCGGDGAHSEAWKRGWHDDTAFSAHAATPALALTATCLRARAYIAAGASNAA